VINTVTAFQLGDDAGQLLAGDYGNELDIVIYKVRQDSVFD
jgi:hypothetical protein